MSTPQPPEPWGQAWSEGSPTGQGAYGDPPTTAFSARQEYGPGQFQGQPPPPPNYGGQVYGSPTPPSKTPGWAWALLALVIVALFGGLGYLAATQLGGSGDAPAAQRPVTETDSAETTPRAVTPSSRPSASPSPSPSPRASVPSNAQPCRATERTADFPSSAVVGNTSCPFAEEVRLAYLQQSQRDASVSVRAWSPTTKQWYTMSCSGSDVVKCAGGNNAVVYVY